MNKAVINILLAGVCFSVVNISVKYLENINIFQLIFFRSLFIFTTSYIIIKQKGIKIWGKHKRLLLMRGVAGSIALSLYFYTLQNMQLASAVTLQYMQPIFSIFLARFLNNEHFNKIQLVFVAMAILGVGVVKNFDPNIDTTLAVIGVAGAVFSSLAYTSIRMLSGKVDANLIIFYFPFITLPLVTPLAIDNWVTPNMNETLVIIAMVIFTYLGQVFLTRGYQGGRMAHVGAFRYIGLIYSVVFGYFLFGESVNIQMALGMILIISGVLLNNKFSIKG